MPAPSKVSDVVKEDENGSVMLIKTDRKYLDWGKSVKKNLTSPKYLAEKLDIAL